MDLVKLTEQGGALYNNEYANAVLNGTQETYLVSKINSILNEQPKLP
jgi:hypothetical protein